MSEQNTKEIKIYPSSGFISDKTHMDYHRTCFDFLGVYNIYIENFFANKLTRWV